MGIFVSVLVILGLGLAAYIPLAPSDPTRWHKMPERFEVGNCEGSASRFVETADIDTLFAKLDHVIMASGSTRLAGSVDQGMATYISRTRIMGFPDYTTVRATDDGLQIYGRLRFGRSDFGVNAKRLDGWIAQLGL